MLRNLSFIALLLSCAFSVMGQKLQLRHLVDGVYVFTTYQDYQGSPVPANGLYVVGDDGVALIDMPWDTTQCLPLLDSIAARHHLPVRWSISTHSHADRTGSINILRRHGVATYASSATKALCIAKGECVPAFTFAQDTTFHLGSLTVEAFYPGPGHTPDNIVVWLAGSRILYGGCFVKSTQSRNLGNLADADVDQWPASLASVTKRFPDPAFIVPGHESWHSKKSILHTLKLLRRHSTKAKMKAP